MTYDPRITVETVEQHVTPDGHRHESQADAIRHLRNLDEASRDERVRDVLDRAFWASDALQDRHDHDVTAFAEKALDMLRDHLPDLRDLAPSLDEIVAAWEGVTPPDMAVPAVPSSTPPSVALARSRGA